MQALRGIRPRVVRISHEVDVSRLGEELYLGI